MSASGESMTEEEKRKKKREQEEEETTQGQSVVDQRLRESLWSVDDDADDRGKSEDSTPDPA